MAGLFGKKPTTTATPPASTLRIQTSVEGKCRAIFYGVTRAPANLIWYGDFYSETSDGGGGGKGGIFGAGASGGGGTSYFASVEAALGEGPVALIGPTVWNGKAVNTMSQLGFGSFLGSDSQLPWSYLSSNHPTQALGYRLTAYVAANASLGSSAELPNYTFEIESTIANAAPGIVDANPKDVIADFLSNTFYGVPGWSSDYNDDWTLPGGYWLAAGLLMSVALTDQVTANQWLKDVITSLNCWSTFSEGVLKIVPLGDKAITTGAISGTTLATTVPDTPDDLPPYSLQVGSAGTFVADQGVRYTGSGTPLTKITGSPNVGQYAVTQSGFYSFAAADQGVAVTISYTQAAVGSYNPPLAPIYAWTDADYLANQGGTSAGSQADPVAATRTAPRNINNVVKVEYLDRSADYNPASVKASDDASVRLYGERGSKGNNTWHWFQYGSAAQAAAFLALGREKVANTYVCTVRPRYILLDVGDLVSISDSRLGLVDQWCRVKDIQENQDRSLTFTLTEYLEGTGASPLYGLQANGGNLPNYNADPGALNTPIIFEPTDELAGGLEIWIAASGAGQFYGGYDAYVSYDGENYQFINRQVGNARMGTLSASLAAVAPNPTGQTIDEAHTLSVDLRESLGLLGSGSQLDATSLNTSCYVDGEIIAYETATLTASNRYDLTYLVRGAYGTEDEIVTHDSGKPFARLDGNILKIPYDQSRVGSTIQIKLVPFNIWFGGPYTVADVAPVTYVITGAALTSPLPNVQNVRTQYTDGFEYIFWDEVSDFRNGVRYKIYKGDSYSGAQQVGDNAHAPFIAFGNGTYWIVAYCQPVAGLFVYSETPTSITITGNLLVKNLVYASDQQAAGWPGIFSNGVAKDGENIRLGGAGNVLAITDFLAVGDVLNYGGIISEGTYEIRPQDYVNVGYLADCSVNASWQAVGSPVGQDILSVADFLAMSDVLGAASTPFINAKIQIATADSPDTGDLYDAGDLYGVTPDLYGYGIAWSDWRDYVPGVYRAWLVKFRLVLTTIDGNTICYVLAFKYQVSVPARIDHYPSLAVPDSGYTITFQPDDAASPSPFNGGPPSGTTNQPLPFVNFSWSGNQTVTPVIDSLTLAALTFHFKDASGTPVAVGNVSVQVEGF